MIYFADLHIHSKYSRATSKDCDLPRLAQWAALKGVRVVTTGDFTHPAWRQEIRDMLVDAEDGLYRLRDEHVPPRLADSPGGFGPGDVRFLLGVEISSIYKKNGATRKVHNLVYMPDFDAMDRFSNRLDRIGNIKSDGRPILGLGSKELLEISLETTEDSFFVPAHIWTPWFSILGSKSGFDAVDECFDDLTPHIFALETGLSSDPEMNFRVSALDRFTLVSYSDTHSPAKLGRQVTVFRGDPGYAAIRDGIRAGGSWARGLSIEELFACENGTTDPTTAPAAMSTFVGTIDFYPEEGKYHLDGHRKCGVRLEPEETEKLGGLCPVCGHAVTVGVMNRVVELSDREKGVIPEHAAPFWRLLPLDELLGQVLGVGPQSKKVQALYVDMIAKLGPELTLLWSYPLDKMARHAPEIIVEAVRRTRSGEVSLLAGFDGEYGQVTVFGEGERAHFSGQSAFLPVQALAPRRPRGSSPGRPRKKKQPEVSEESLPEHPSGLNPEQLAAVNVRDRPVLVQAGPGTGKTRTLTHRIAALLESGEADPSEITAVTFTRKASQEMRDRLDRMIPERSADCWLGTFHQLAARILDLCGRLGGCETRATVLDEDRALALFKEAVTDAHLDVRAGTMSSLFGRISLLKQNLISCVDSTSDPLVTAAYQAYQDRLRQAAAMDLDDLLTEPVRLLKQHPDVCCEIGRTCCRHLLVDEFQDVNRAQYEMVRLLAGEEGRGLFVIGDPNQAIYGFRGADRRFFFRFADDYPSCYKVSLVNNYRSQANVVAAADHVLDAGSCMSGIVAVRAANSRVRKVQLPTEATEAEFIIRTIDAFLGGVSFYAIDTRTLPVETPGKLGFGDFAILYRLNAVGDALEKAFQQANIPFQRARRASPEEEAEAHDPRADAVSLMTIHASKGLEFPVVFVAGCEDRIVPYVRPGDETLLPEDLDEERRLLYVAMTRACDELFLTRSVRRTVHGRRLDGQWSPFLKDMPASLCERLKPLEGNSTAKREKSRQYELFG